MEDKKYMKKIVVLLLSLYMFISLAFSNAYASETRIDTETAVQTEAVSVESEETHITEESLIESQNLYETDFEILETETDETEIVVTESDKKDLTIEGIEEVLGYYNFILTYDDLIQLKNAGYDISGFDENIIMEEIAGTPSVFSMASEHDVTYVGQATVSYSKADADKLYLFGSNSYYKNGTYTRIYGTKKRITIGSTVYVGFCFEPSGTDPLADTVLDCYRLNNRQDIVKALYYGFGGPGFESGGFKALLDGISSGNSYFYSGGRENCYEVLTHCLIGKLYGDSAWAMGLSQESANAVITMESMLNNLPDPINPVISLVRHDGAAIKNEGTYIENGYQRTTTLVVSGDSRNSLSITLPNGIEAVDGGGKVFSGTFSLNGGTAFYLRAGLNYSGTYNSGNIKGVCSTSYVPYMIFGGEGTKQDCGTLFAETCSSSTSMSVVFKGTTGKLTIKKTSSNAQLAENGTEYSDLSATFHVYNASGAHVGTIKTDKAGNGSLSNLSLGEYTVKEITAPIGYKLNTISQSFKITEKETTKTLTFVNDPLLGKIKLTKVIYADDINFDNGNPMFMFKVSGVDAKGEQRILYKIVDFTREYVDKNTNSQGNVSITVEFDDLIAGTYIAKEMETSRYLLESISNIHNGIRIGNEVKFILTTTGNMDGEATFTNDNYEQQDYSDTSKIINELKGR